MLSRSSKVDVLNKKGGKINKITINPSIISVDLTPHPTFRCPQTFRVWGCNSSIHFLNPSLSHYPGLLEPVPASVGRRRCTPWTGCWSVAGQFSAIVLYIVFHACACHTLAIWPFMLDAFWVLHWLLDFRIWEALTLDLSVLFFFNSFSPEFTKSMT